MYDFINLMGHQQEMADERARVRHYLEQTRWQPFQPEPGLIARAAGWLRKRMITRSTTPTRPVRAAGPMGCSA